MPQSIYDNGGMIGATLDFGDTDKYVIGTTTQAATVEYLGFTAGDGGDNPLSLPSGLQEGDTVFIASASDNSDNGDIVIGFNNYGYTTVYSGVSSTGGVYYTLGYKRMGSTPDTFFNWPSIESFSSIMAFAFRGVSTSIQASSTFASNTTTGMPAPPNEFASNFGETSFPQGSMMLSLGYLDDDEIQSGITAPSDLTLAGSFASASSSSTVMAAYYIFPSATTSLTVGAFGGSGTDAWYGRNVLVYPDIEEIPIFGNQKNSGIWSLTAALEAVPEYGFISATTQSANAASMPVPTGLQAGDLLIYAFAADVAASNLGSSPDIPTGFTLGQGIGTASGGMVWAYKIADGSETTISPIDNGRTTENIHAAFIFRNAAIASTGSAQITSGTSVIPPSISALTNEYVIIIAAQDSASATATGPAGYTEIVDATGTDANIYIGYKQIASDGTETPGAVTFSSTNVGDSDYSATFTIGPA